jgi:hypothetical protein
VKAAPIAKKRGGVALPLDGWDSIELSAGGSCDRCQDEIAIGATAWYHKRTGEAYCAKCARDVGALEAREVESAGGGEAR